MASVYMLKFPAPVMLIVFVLVVVSLLATPSSSSSSTDQNNNDRLIRICGRELMNMLKGLCKNCIRGASVQTLVKRDPSGHFILNLDKRTISATEEDELVGMRHGRAADGGIARECCERQCSYRYMKGFCMPEQECKKIG